MFGDARSAAMRITAMDGVVFVVSGALYQVFGPAGRGHRCSEQDYPA